MIINSYASETTWLIPNRLLQIYRLYLKVQKITLWRYEGYIMHVVHFTSAFPNISVFQCLSHLLKNVHSSRETFKPGAVVQAALYKFVPQAVSFHGMQLTHHWSRKCTIILQICLGVSEEHTAVAFCLQNRSGGVHWEVIANIHHTDTITKSAEAPPVSAMVFIISYS